MKNKTQNQPEPSRIQKAQKAIRDFCSGGEAGEVVWEMGIPSNRGPYVFQLIKVFSETAEREPQEMEIPEQDQRERDFQFSV